MNLTSLIIINIINLSLIYLLNLNRLKISKNLKLIDFPNNDRKIHNHETPLIGGLIISSIYLLNIIFLFFIFESFNNLSILLLSLLSFLIGFFDDRKNINSYLRLFLFFALIVSFLLFNEILIIKNIYFDFLNLKYELGFISIPFTTLCILLLINAINLSDGINSLAILIIIYILLYLHTYNKGIEQYLLLNLIISLIFICYFNYRGNFFLGNSGSYFLGMFVSLSIISTYNVNLNHGLKINSEELFIILFLPGVDMFRLFVERIFKKKNPFDGDKNHFHHFLIERFSLTKSLVIYSVFMITPYLVFRILNIEPLIIILFFILVYIFLLTFFKKQIYLK